MITIPIVCFQDLKFLFQLSIVNGIIGLWETVQLDVELAQEITHVLSWSRKKMEELAPANLLKFCNVKIRNAPVRIRIFELLRSWRYLSLNGL